MDREKEARKARKIIARYGGPSRLAFALSIDRRVVWNWRTRGIPKPWQMLIDRMKPELEGQRS